MFSFISVFLITISLLNCPLSPHFVSIELHCRAGLREKVMSSTRSNGLLHLLISWIFQGMYPVYYEHKRQNNFNRYPPYNISPRFLFFFTSNTSLTYWNPLYGHRLSCARITLYYQQSQIKFRYQLHSPHNTSSPNLVSMKKYYENNNKIFIK